MFSTKFNLLKPFSRLVKKQKLETLDYIYKAQPFCDIVSKNQNTYNLDTIYKSQPFVGTPNNYIKNTSGSNNIDVDNWIDTVYLNGGSASSTTIAALNTFCNSIDEAGLRNKFYRLNLYCGNDIRSCLVPIYNSPYKNSIQYGFGVDLNRLYTQGSDNFVYSENQGLLGNTQDISGNSFLSRRYLNTGLILGNDIIFNNNLHFSTYCNNITHDTTTSGQALGVLDSAGVGFGLKITLNNFETGAFANSRLNYSNSSSPKNYPSNKGLYVATYSNNILNFYEGRGSRLGYRDITLYPITMPATSTVTIFAENRSNTNGALYNFIDYMQGYSIGLSLSQSEIEAYYDIMQTFQTSLNRNV
jgi:hypothetical protein